MVDERRSTMPTLVKQSLLPEFETMERRFRRMFEGMPLMPAFLPATAATPAADVYETEREVVVEVEVPGYEQQELGLELSDHTLTVKGTRSELTDEREKNFALHERLEHTFERTFVLPREIDAEHVSAEFKKGVITVHAPKLPAARQRTVPLET
jgi:HSP20 family protein